MTDRNGIDDSLTSAPRSPLDIPVQRQPSHELLISEEARDRLRAPRTQRQILEEQRSRRQQDETQQTVSQRPRRRLIPSNPSDHSAQSPMSTTTTGSSRVRVGRTIPRFSSSTSFLNFNQFIFRDFSYDRLRGIGGRNGYADSFGGVSQAGSFMSGTNESLDPFEDSRFRSFKWVRSWLPTPPERLQVLRPSNVFNVLVMSPYQRVINFVKDVLQRIHAFFSLLFSATVIAGISGSLFISLFITGLALSVAGYWIAWWYLIPPMQHRLPLFFDFDPALNGQHAFACTASQFPDMLELPTAIVNLNLANHQYELHQTALEVPGRMKHPQKAKPLLKKGGKKKKKKKISILASAKKNLNAEKEDASDEPAAGFKKKKKKRPKLKLQRTSDSKADFSVAEKSLERIEDWRLKSLAGKQKQFLRMGEKYDIIVRLTLRDNEHNDRLANFMVRSDLITPQEKVIASSRRPAIVNFTPAVSNWWLRWDFVSWIGPFPVPSLHLLYQVLILPFSVILWILSLPFRVLTFFTPTHLFSDSVPDSIGEGKTLQASNNMQPLHRKLVLDVMAFEEFKEQSFAFLSVNSVRVTLSQPCVQLWDAMLLFKTKLEGYRYFMYHYKWLSFVLYIVIVMWVEINYLVITSVLIATLLWVNRESINLYR